MIKVNQHEVQFKGEITMILAELSMLCHELVEATLEHEGTSEEDIKHDIRLAVEEGLRPVDEIIEEAKEKLKDMTLGDLMDLISRMKGENNNGNEFN